MAEHTRLLRVSGALCESLRMAERPDNSTQSLDITDVVVAIVFVTAFLASASVLAFQTLDEIHDWWRARSWVEVPCWIEHLDVEKVHHGKGGSTWDSRAVYRYVFAGKERRNCAIDLHQKNKHRIAIGEKHQMLRIYQGSEKPFRCFVNPVSPYQVTLFRDLRTGELLTSGGFSTVIFAMGIGFLVSRVREFRHIRNLKRSQKAHPDQPWRWRSEWLGAVIAPSTTNAFWLSMVVFWGLVNMGSLAWAVWMNGSLSGEWLVLLALLIMVVMTLELIRRAAGRWQMGMPRLVLCEYPLRPGGVLKGMLKLRPGKRQLTLRLVCEEWSRSGEAINSRRVGDTVSCIEAEGETAMQMPLPGQWPGTTADKVFVPSREKAWRWVLLVSSNRWMKPVRLLLPVFEMQK